jgi:DNA polymerase
MPILHVDIETASEIDLREVGVHTYAEHPSTVITVIAYALDDGPVKTINPGSARTTGTALHVAKEVAEFVQIASRPDVVIHAFNAEFEFTLLRSAFNNVPPFNLDDVKLKWRCTMAQGLYWGLPAALDDAGQALGAPTSMMKDKTAHGLMMRMSRPRSRAPNLAWWHIDDPQKLAELTEYCKQDVEAERWLSKNLDPLPRTEHKMWAINVEMNAAGVNIDHPFVDALLKVSEELRDETDKKLSYITGGEVTSSTQLPKLRAWALARGYTPPSLDRGSIENFLRSNPNVDPDLKIALNLRLDVSKSSTKKLERIKKVAGGGDVCRGLISYYGAARTGRYSGKLIQPQNLPRGNLKPQDVEAIRGVLVGFPPIPTPPMTLDQVSSCVRGTIIPPKDHFMLSGDLAQIEARVLAWLAGQMDILGVFANGGDVYTYAAAKLGSPDRQLGKVVTLGLGYGMGYIRFIDTAKTYKIVLNAVQANAIVTLWRDNNPSIVKFWIDVERAFRRAINQPAGIAYPAGDKISITSYEENGQRNVVVILPSKRLLVYRDCRDDPNEGLSYHGVDQKTTVWGEIRTYGARVVENITQAVARDVIVRALYYTDDDEYLTPVLTVHDEIVVTCPFASLSITDAKDRLHKLLTQKGTWMTGLPVAATVTALNRYAKI